MDDLCALADGTLPDDRRPEVEARVAASPELQMLLERQRRAVLSVQALTDEPPTRLQAEVEARAGVLAAKRGRSRRRVPRFVVVGAAAVASVIVAAVVLTGGPGSPTVADAARLATQPATGPAPPSAGTSGTRLAIGIEGVAFPDYARAYGWHALGVKHGRVDGRDATVVYYGKGSRRLAYVIVSGPGLNRPSATRASVVGQVEYRVLRLNDKLAVTWRRGGHTCILVGDATPAELLNLASWPLSPSR